MSGEQRGALLERVRALLARKASAAVLRERDRWTGTYSVGRAPEALGSHLKKIVPEAVSGSEALLAVTEHYCARRFDLLGSGWLVAEHGHPCRGFGGVRYGPYSAVAADTRGEWLRGRINPSNLGEAQRVWRLIDSSYQPIDWQRDFRSGFRWSESTWYRDIAIGRPRGADIKVPWELGRLQHLPQLALAALGACSEDQSAGNSAAAGRAERFARAVRNQALDFIACNPPRFGANWNCTMDVAIRAVNLMVAQDLLRAGGWSLDPDFSTVLARSIREHARHIAGNLEWHPRLRTNHYLANVVGLLFAGAYCPRDEESDVWLAFGVQELVREVEHQFWPDGGNFEASTCYHRLSAEMVVWGTALVVGLPPLRLSALGEYDHRLHRGRPSLKPAPLPVYSGVAERDLPFPPWYADRLERMAAFTAAISKPDGRVAQFGDNDSGRLLKLRPVWHRRTVAQARERYRNLDGYADLPDEAAYWDEDHLDHAHLPASVRALFGEAGAMQHVGRVAADAIVVRCLAGGTRLRARGGPEQDEAGWEPGPRRDGAGAPEDWDRVCAEAGEAKLCHTYRLAAPGASLRTGLACASYPDFGLYILRSQRLYLAIRCGQHGQDGVGGHAHNDQLSLELCIDGREYFSDPGTFVYTADPAARNRYRSVQAHFGPRAPEGSEPAPLREGLFRLRDIPKAQCLYAGPDGFAGVHHGYGYPVFRLVRIQAEEITITDYTSEPKGLMRLPLEELSGSPEVPGISSPVPFSPGYGLALA